MKRKRGLVGHQSPVDVGELNRAGAFSGGPFWFPFRQLTTDKFSMEYRGSEWPEDRPAQRVHVRWTHCYFGGMRPWLVCPCGKRVAKLYPGFGQYLGCRNCVYLTYQSQLRSQKGRVYRKAEEIRWQLWDNGRPGVDPLPNRPYRMHRKRFAELLTSLANIERVLTDPSVKRRNRPYARLF